MPAENAERSATATAEPPQQPPAPPASASAASGPEPRRPRGAGCAIAAVAIVAILAAGLGGLWLVNQRVSSVGVVQPGAGGQTAFASAMKKAGVKSPPAPGTAVDLANVHALGSHQFDATFSPAEITALLQAFSYTPPTGTRLTVRVDKLEVTGGAITMTGNVNAGGSSYSGSVTSPVRFSAGSIQADGAAKADVGGLTVRGAQASQAVGALLDYFNAYIAAAPGLKIASAVVVDGNVHVTGTAPDTLSW